jgi:hypothetical protein
LLLLRKRRARDRSRDRASSQKTKAWHRRTSDDLLCAVPNRISLDRHSSLTDLTRRSAYAFRLCIKDAGNLPRPPGLIYHQCSQSNGSGHGRVF